VISGSHFFTISGGTIIIEDWIGTMGYIEHTGGLFTVKDVEAWNVNGTGQCINSNVVAGPPLVQGFTATGCIFGEGASFYEVKVVGTVNIFYGLYDCQIADAKEVLTGTYTNTAVQSVYSGAIRTREVRVGDETGLKYTLPAVDGTAGQVLETDGAGNVNWKTNFSFALQFGGNLNATNDYAIPSGHPGLATNTVATNQETAVIPAPSNLLGYTYSTALGDATTQMELFINGLSQGITLLTGAQGVHTFVAPISVNQGDFLLFRHVGGQIPQQSNYSIYGSI
jgi:hypothetical protein